MRAVDTNVLVRLLTRDDHAQAERAETFVANGAWVSHVVLVEATWVLSAVYQFDSKRIATAVEMLLDHETLSIQEPEVVHAALGHLRKKSKASFSDCLILEIARTAGHLPLGSFDRGLGGLSGVQRL